MGRFLRATIDYCPGPDNYILATPFVAMSVIVILTAWILGVSDKVLSEAERI